MTGATRATAAGVTCLITALACPAGAQVVRGEVRDESTGAPIAGAAVAVSDTTRAVVGFERTDDRGQFSIRVAIRQYVVRVVRVGFQPESLTTAGIEAPSAVDVVVEMHPIPRTLAPAVIEAERVRIRATNVMGLSLMSPATHIITPTEIAIGAAGARNYLDAIRTALPPGVIVSERELCAGPLRSAGVDGVPDCALVVVDGVPYVGHPEIALDLVQPRWLDHAIFLDAADAGMRFGTGSAGGALLLFTKHGGYALDADAARALAPRRP